MTLEEPASAGVRPGDGEVLHFSENLAIIEFVPHVAATARVNPAYVWAVDAARAPDYWFPLYAYRLPAKGFEPIIEPQPAEPTGEPEPHAHASTKTVHPLGPPGSRGYPLSSCGLDGRAPRTGHLGS